MANTIVTTNQTLTDADTQYEVTIPEGVRYVTIQCRTAFDMRGAFVTGKVATPTAPYFTIKSGGALSLPIPQHHSDSLFLASAQAGVVAEIVWSQAEGS